MEFSEVVRRRRMVRNLTDEPIDPAVRDRILDAMHRAPSAGFSQGFEFLVFEGASSRAFWDVSWPATERVGPHAGVTNAPLVIVPCAHMDTYLDRYAEPDKGWTDRSESHWPVPFWLTDTAFAAMLGLLAVVDEGLGALFFGLFREPAVRDAFGIPDAYKPIGAIAVGHRAPDVPSPSLARGRRSLEDIVHLGGWANAPTKVHP